MTINNPAKIPKALEILCLIVLSMVFFFSGLTKFLNPQQFVVDTYFYHILPVPWLNMLCMILIMLELTVSASIWVPKLRASSSLLIAGMMLMFIIFIFSTMIRGLNISCGCFGKSSQSAGWSKIAENLVLLLCAVTVFARNLPTRSNK